MELTVKKIINTEGSEHLFFRISKPRSLWFECYIHRSVNKTIQCHKVYLLLYFTGMLHQKVEK